MPNYDFKMLDDKEFEIFCCQLLSKELRVRFERFKKGRDGGVDGRFFKEDKTEEVLQCKHWARSTVSALLRSLKDKELPKVKKLKPSRYFLATSLELSRSDKKKIASIFSEFMHSESDVFGCEDINDLLAKFPDLQKDHPRLWFSSAEVLDLIENAAILGRSEFSINEIREKAIRYVETANHRVAKEKLETLGTVLITGIPGIGKTTLAEQLCLEYVLDKYQLCVLGQSIEEAENVYKKDAKQLFYFDDFLGRNYLAALDRHEDSRIVGFITRVSKDPQKRFVLTSRTTVLNQAKTLSDQFLNTKTDRNEFEIRVESLDPIDKAHILHKHIWHSDLSPDLIDQILSRKRYREIINHKNFNPRLIQFITDAQRFDDQNAQDYWPYIERTLSNPAAIWEHVYDGQLDDFSRGLLLLVVFNGGPIREDDLRSASDRFRHEPIAVGYLGSSDFSRNSRLVSGSVLNRSIGTGGAVRYSLFNPSIADYVLKRVPSDQAMVETLFFSLNTFSSLKNLGDLVSNNIIQRGIASHLIESLLERKLGDAQLDIDYLLKLADIGLKFVADNQRVKDHILQFLSSMPVVDETFGRWDILGSFLRGCIKNSLIESEYTSRFFAEFESKSINSSDIDGMVDLYNVIGTDEKRQLEPILRMHILEYWEDGISETISESSTVGDFLSEDDIFDVKESVKEVVRESLGSYPFSFSTNEVERIANHIDPYDVIYENQQRLVREDYEEREYIPRDSGPDAIDELFKIDVPR